MALLQMEQDGLLRLPVALTRNQSTVKRGVPRTSLGEPGLQVNCRVDELNGIQLKSAKGKTPEGRLWSELVDRYHYLGYRPLSGANLRYLIRSRSETLLGCLGFGAAAWKCAARDQHIGWSSAMREKNLERVVDNSRFLILPWIQVKGLASKALSLAARVLPEHWEQAYGYRPLLLETFVEMERFRGTCYQAANWVCVGKTQGRSKYDRHHQLSKPIKSVWLYPLHKNFRQDLCR